MMKINLASSTKCTICGGPLRSDNKVGVCKRTVDCINERGRLYARAHHDKVVERHRKWRQRNPDKVRDMKRDWRTKNIDKVRQQERLWNLANPDKVRAANLRSHYGLSVEQYDELLASQGGHCAICPNTGRGDRYGRLSVDHDHITGAIRGLLCASHNHMLGQAHDSPEELEAGAAYLRKSRQQQSSW